MLNLKRDALNCAFILAILMIACSKSNSNHSGGSGTTPTPGITSANPLSGPDSTKVTITGTGFSATAANDGVFFNGKQATVLSASDSVIVAMVPTLAGSGTIKVEANGGTYSGPVFTYDTTYAASIYANNILDPNYLAFDANGNLIVSTNDNFYVVASGDSKVTTTPNVYGNLNEGVVIDGSNNLYFCSLHNIYKVASGGTDTVVIATDDSSTLYGLAMDAGGNLYASSVEKQAIEKITPQGAVSIFASGLRNVTGLAMGADGNLYAAYSPNEYSPTAGEIVKFSASGSMTEVCTGLPVSDQTGIYVDGNNNCFVACYIISSTSTSVYKVAAGSSTAMAIFTDQYPLFGITGDKAGNLYVSQTNQGLATIYGCILKLTMH
jgi:glucose/arabinose dehydrogenase